MSSFFDIVIAFVAALITAAFAHFGASEVPSHSRDRVPASAPQEADSLDVTPTSPDSAPAPVSTPVAVSAPEIYEAQSPAETPEIASDQNLADAASYEAEMRAHEAAMTAHEAQLRAADINRPHPESPAVGNLSLEGLPQADASKTEPNEHKMVMLIMAKLALDETQLQADIEAATCDEVRNIAVQRPSVVRVETRQNL